MADEQFMKAADRMVEKSRVASQKTVTLSAAAHERIQLILDDWIRSGDEPTPEETPSLREACEAFGVEWVSDDGDDGDDDE